MSDWREEIAVRNQATVNARVAREGRCMMHPRGVSVPATQLLALPIGNVVPLCDECTDLWRSDAAESGDPHMQPVSIEPLVGAA